MTVISGSQPASAVEPQLKGWNYLHSLLIQAGIPSVEATKIFADSRMPAYEPLVFNAKPAEPHSLYQKRNSPAERANALKFFARHQASFHRAAGQFNVPESVILSILQIETHCGGFTGKTRILPGIARLASASDPQQLQRNLDFNLKRHGAKIDAAAVQARGNWLTNTFLPHVIAGIQLARYSDRDPLELRGSGSGALGLPQFLPANVFAYGLDGSGDGKLDMYQPEDAILSVAHYLSAHGWTKRHLDPQDQRAVIWNYNRSEPYIDTVLAMARSLDRPISEARASSNLKNNSLVVAIVPAFGR